MLVCYVTHESSSLQKKRSEDVHKPTQQNIHQNSLVEKPKDLRSFRR